MLSQVPWYLAMVKEGASKEDAVVQVFSEELLPFFEFASSLL
jgi:hypothetical protein